MLPSNGELCDKTWLVGLTDICISLSGPGSVEIGSLSASVSQELHSRFLSYASSRLLFCSP